MNEVTPARILDTGLAFWASKTLLSAVELELFTVLAEGPADLATLKARLGLHERAAADFLDCLVALGFLTREEGVYANTPETEAFLYKRKPSYIGGILVMANNRLFPSWSRLTEALRTGLPQSDMHANDGGDFFGELYSDPKRLEEFLKSMSGISRGANMAMANKLPWDRYRTFVDAGTAQGDLAAQIALAQPHLRGTGFDLPQVQPVFEAYMRELGIADRVGFQAGSFFEDDLPKADVVLMGHILHDWSLEEKKHLTAKAYAALPPGGLFVAYDSLIDDERRTHAFGLLMSLNMLIETPAGFDYTGAQCRGWMHEAGFRETRVEHLVGPDWMVIGEK